MFGGALAATAVVVPVWVRARALPESAIISRVQIVKMAIREMSRVPSHRPPQRLS